MKAIFFTLFSLAASALATPLLAQRQLETQADEIDRLTELVMSHTANINETVASVVDNPNLEQQNAAAAALGPDFQAITDALTQATAAIGSSAAQLVVVAAVKGRDAAGGACGHDCLLTKVQLLVWEIASTLKFVIVKLGLACVLDYLQPLLFALVGLIKALDKVVAGLLIVVKSLLTFVLGTVAGAVLELLW
ncbi:uncharacterized protein B0T15DRAFT_438497 [Chaetomium strumarium]|uniref:Uncharacterized protein n=1 Tax=Chaetomium strumarium TaxID=1170767 RepID=A0AAJ0GNW9_9PEZI|nr:hypothetical protein B0T15DRAFT_438497 [Chaetomium strumarium]